MTRAANAVAPITSPTPGPAPHTPCKTEGGVPRTPGPHIGSRTRSSPRAAAPVATSAVGPGAPGLLRTRRPGSALPRVGLTLRGPGSKSPGQRLAGSWTPARVPGRVWWLVRAMKVGTWAEAGQRGQDPGVADEAQAGDGATGRPAAASEGPGFPFRARHFRRPSVLHSDSGRLVAR